MTAILKGLLFSVGKKLVSIVSSMATEKFAEWMLFYAAEKLVKSTATKVDDEWFEKIKANYEEVNSKGGDTSSTNNNKH